MFSCFQYFYDEIEEIVEFKIEVEEESASPVYPPSPCASSGHTSSIGHVNKIDTIVGNRMETRPPAATSTPVSESQGTVVSAHYSSYYNVEHIRSVASHGSSSSRGVKRPRRADAMHRQRHSAMANGFVNAADTNHKIAVPSTVHNLPMNEQYCRMVADPCQRIDRLRTASVANHRDESRLSASGVSRSFNNGNVTSSSNEEYASKYNRQRISLHERFANGGENYSENIVNRQYINGRHRRVNDEQPRDIINRHIASNSKSFRIESSYKNMDQISRQDRRDNNKTSEAPLSDIKIKSLSEIRKERAMKNSEAKTPQLRQVSDGTESVKRKFCRA